MDALKQIERYISAEFRTQIEERYLAPINVRASLEQTVHDPLLTQDPEHYPPFFADHGVVHHRDVARQILQVLDTAHGLLIPARAPGRLQFMKGYGVILAYLHDIGMSDFSHFGRVVHPGAAPQAVFQPEFDDIQEDAIESFRRPATPQSLKAAADMEILLEGVDDNLEFAGLVREDLELINPQAAARTRCVPSMQHASGLELARYLQADAPDWDLDTRRQALERIARSGHRTEGIDPTGGFRDVKLLQLERGDVLLEAGAPSGFAYIPLDVGLRIIPLGGYASFAVRPWMPWASPASSGGRRGTRPSPPNGMWRCSWSPKRSTCGSGIAPTV